MISIPAALPYLLDHVDLRRKGWDRKARVLTVVAAKTSVEPHRPAPISRRDFLAIAPTARAARSDADALEELVGEPYRILISGTVGRDRVYRFAGVDLAAVARWRHVPWIGSQSRALVVVRRKLSGATLAAVDATAGQRVREGAPNASFGHLSDLDLSVKTPPAAPRTPPVAPNPGSATSTDAANPATGAKEPADPFTASSGVLRTPSLPQTREGGSGELAEQLRRRLIEVLGAPYIEGALWERCKAVAAMHADNPEALLARCDTFVGTRSVRLALDALEECTLAATASPAQLVAQLEHLRRLHATWVGLEELDRAEELAAEIERIESVLGARPAQ